MNEEVQKVLDVIGGPLPTCSIYNLKPNSVTFCRKSIFTIPDTPENLFVVLSRGVIHQGWAIPIYVDITDWTFWKYHNWYWGNHYTNYEITKTRPSVTYIGCNCQINNTAILGTIGVTRIYNGKDYIDPMCIGGVIIGERTIIGANSVINRGTIDDTIIGLDVHIGALNVIGHNCQIGDRTLITSGVSVGGSVTIGENCFIGMGAVIRDNIEICPNVYIGMGSVVTKNITQEGKWYGIPARYVQ